MHARIVKMSQNVWMAWCQSDDLASDTSKETNRWTVLATYDVWSTFKKLVLHIYIWSVSWSWGQSFKNAFIYWSNACKFLTLKRNGCWRHLSLVSMLYFLCLTLHCCTMSKYWVTVAHKRIWTLTFFFCLFFIYILVYSDILRHILLANKNWLAISPLPTVKSLIHSACSAPWRSRSSCCMPRSQHDEDLDLQPLSPML